VATLARGEDGPPAAPRQSMMRRRKWARDARTFRRSIAVALLASALPAYKQRMQSGGTSGNEPMGVGKRR
jgi:hypothetical protein